MAPIGSDVCPADDNDDGAVGAPSAKTVVVTTTWGARGATLRDGGMKLREFVNVCGGGALYTGHGVEGARPAILLELSLI